MHDVYGTFGISVFALRGATIDELTQQAPLVAVVSAPGVDQPGS